MASRTHQLLTRSRVVLFALTPLLFIFASDLHAGQPKELAQRFANEYALAQAGGADFSDVRGVRSAIEKLANGVSGTGAYAGLQFRVEHVTAPTAASAAKYLKFDNHVLRYTPPPNYRIAWKRGFSSNKKPAPRVSLNHLLLERRAKSIARLFEQARASGANLSSIKSSQDALALLEKGIAGRAAKAGINFSIDPLDPADRSRLRKMLTYHEGNLYFMSEDDRRSGRDAESMSEKNRPAHLAQKIAALFNVAASTGAELGDASSPAELVEKLRLGVRSTNEMGSQFFRISEVASQSDWDRSIAYLRLEDGNLRYAPPSAR